MYCVLGSRGFLGQECVKYLKIAKRSVYESVCRLEDAEQDIIKSGAKFVICAAGISGRPTIDWCDAHEEETKKTNYDDMLTLIEICRGLKVHLTIFGSGGVYSGKKSVYTEDDPPDFDQKVYFKYRIMLEQKLEPHVLYLRIMYPCTFDGNPKCFYQKIWSRRNNLHDVSVSITSTRDLFPLIPELVENNNTGIYNFVNRGTISLKDMVKAETCTRSDDQRGSYELSTDKLEKIVKVPPIKIPQVLIVGAGITGCTIARCLAEKGYHIRVIDSRDHIGGNCYDYENEHGIRIHKYGPHFFHTNNSNVWNFVNRFAKFIPYKVTLRSKVENLYVPIPVNIETVNTLFGLGISTSTEMENWLKTVQTHYDPTNSRETALNLCGPALYSLLFRGYTRKQWNRDASELDPSVLKRIPIHTSDYDGPFTDTYQGLPENGYTDMFRNMLSHPLIDVELSTDYFSIRYEVQPLRTYYTGRIDMYFRDSGLEPLEYRSLDFIHEHHEEEYHQPHGIINFPDEAVPWTRSVEYKHFPGHSSNTSSFTTTVKEYPSGTGEPYYPVPNSRNQNLYEKYKELALKEKSVIFSGRLATYKYYNMDQAIEAAFTVIDQE